jgi:hypothetical protein
MKLILLAVVTISVMLPIPQVYAFGDQAHKAIWASAQAQLSSKAKKQVSQILNQDKLAMTATWLDEARNSLQHHKGKLVGDPETDDFNAKFPDHPNWHFVNLPLDATSYDIDGFTSQNDVVQRIEFCIRVLEGHNSSLSKRIALRALVHLTGDIHQPMHCVAGYYDTSDLDHPQLITGVVQAKQFKLFNDRGANQLHFGSGQFDKLHTFWDGELPKEITGGSASYKELAEILNDRIQSDGCIADPGDFHKWPEQWAAESVAQAKLAYADLKFNKCKLGSSSPDTKIQSIDITMPDNYAETFATVAEIQMSKAACRLAAVLNKIFH